MSDVGKRRVYVTPEALGRMFSHGTQETTTNMPKNAELSHIYPAEDGARYIFVFESPEWPPLEEGETVPEMEVWFTEVDE